MGRNRRPRCHLRRLAYLNNRYYDPGVGVFTSVDPLVGKTGTPYLYGLIGFQGGVSPSSNDQFGLPA